MLLTRHKKTRPLQEISQNFHYLFRYQNKKIKMQQVMLALSLQKLRALLNVLSV